MVSPRFVPLMVALLPTMGTAQSMAVETWRDARRGIASEVELVARADVRKDLRLSPAQIRRIDAIPHQADYPFINRWMTKHGMWTVYTQKTMDGRGIAALLPFSQRRRLQSLSYQALGTLALLETDFQSRLHLSRVEVARLSKIEDEYARLRFTEGAGPIMNDPPPYDQRPDPKARRALDACLLAVLASDQRRLYARMCGRIVPSLAAITPHTG